MSSVCYVRESLHVRLLVATAGPYGRFVMRTASLGNPCFSMFCVDANVCVQLGIAIENPIHISLHTFLQGGDTVCGYPIETVPDWCSAGAAQGSYTNSKMNVQPFCYSDYGAGTWQPNGMTPCSKVCGEIHK